MNGTVEEEEEKEEESKEGIIQESLLRSDILRLQGTCWSHFMHDYLVSITACCIILQIIAALLL